jgi:putative ABC transport system ATP-binding protein
MEWSGKMVVAGRLFMIPLISLENVRKIYDTGTVKVPALRGVSLEVSPGEFAAIVGASGSGKSTLMNILGCLDRPTSGVYRLSGRDVSRLGRDELAHLRNAKFGFVFQGFNLLRRHTALDNVELPLLYAGMPARQRRKRALEMLKLVGLADWATHQPNQLSGGQQQRVAIARALVNQPEVVLADEPTGNLDSRAGAEIIDELERLNRQRGQTILLVTHDPAIASRAARVITVRDGLISGDTRREDHTLDREPSAMYPLPAEYKDEGLMRHMPHSLPKAGGL